MEIKKIIKVWVVVENIIIISKNNWAKNFSFEVKE
jgi:hypothetical protein